MKAMPQSAKALKLVGDVHASNSGGREKVELLALRNKYLLNTFVLKFSYVFNIIHIINRQKSSTSLH